KNQAKSNAFGAVMVRCMKQINGSQARTETQNRGRGLACRASRNQRTHQWVHLPETAVQAPLRCDCIRGNLPGEYREINFVFPVPEPLCARGVGGLAGERKFLLRISSRHQ